MSNNPGRTLARDSMAFVLAGGRGSRLRELTDDCAKPAIHFGGGSRIIDFALSNAINSGIPHIGVATQYKQASLIRHLEQAARLHLARTGGNLEVLPGWSGNAMTGDRYRGTADAVFQNIDVLRRYAPRHVVILAGDHVYKMDYEPMLRQHVDSGADVTVGCLVVPRLEATGFGVMHVDAKDTITDFVEKPKDPPGIPGEPDFALASMGIYVFDTAFLLDELRRDAMDLCSAHDFGGDIIPHVVAHGKAVAHRFSKSCVRTAGESEAYWRDVGTLDSYFEANLDVASAAPPFAMHDGNWPLWTGGPEAKRALFAPQLGERAELDEAVILPRCSLGPGVRLRRVIVDAGVRIPAGLVVGEDADADARRFRRTQNGVCLITQRMIDRLPERLAMRSAA